QYAKILFTVARRAVRDSLCTQPLIPICVPRDNSPMNTQARVPVFLSYTRSSVLVDNSFHHTAAISLPALAFQRDGVREVSITLVSPSCCCLDILKKWSIEMRGRR